MHCLRGRGERLSPDIDYYGYTPLITPDQPLALVGLPAAHVGGTARLVSSFTGLPLFWMDRAVEHRAGASIDAIVLEKGDQVRREHERALLPRVLDAPTPHVMVLSEVTLADPELGPALRSRTTVFALRRHLDEVIATIAAAHEKRPPAYARLLLGRKPDPAALAEELQRLAAHHQDVDHELDVTGMHPQHAAQAVIDALGWKLPVIWERPKD